MSKWIKCKDRLPEEDGLYLIADIVIADVVAYHTRYFARDLYKADDIDFADYKGVSGWYYYDDEYGYCECDAEAWMPIEPYSRKDEPQTEGYDYTKSEMENIRAGNGITREIPQTD